MTANDSTTDDATGAPTDQRTHVRERYADVASGDSDCCDEPATDTDGDCCGDSSVDADTDTDTDTDYCDTAATDSDCCGAPDDPFELADDPSRALSLGYDADDLEAAPEESNLGLGRGNPVAISNLEAGETVLDLGSGGGFDCFLAAREVGPAGRVIDVDMTPEMLDRARENAAGLRPDEPSLADARENAAESEFENVEFRLGEIEHLPVADATVDAIISNCVVNLSPDKRQVLAEAYRVLRPGGTLAISDPVAIEPLPQEVRENPDAVDACVGGAATVDELDAWLADVGFVDNSIALEGEWTEDPPVASARIEARKPV